MMKIPPIKQLPDNPNDLQLKAIAAHIIHLNNPKFNGVTVKTLTRDGEIITGTFTSDGSSYKFDLDTDDLFLSFAPDNAPISLSGGEIHDYIEFINATDEIANPADELTDKLAPLIQPEINAMIGAIADQLFSSDDLGLAQEKIAGLYGQLKTDTLAKQFSLSVEAARLVGAYDAQSDIEDQEIDLELKLDDSELIDFKREGNNG